MIIFARLFPALLHLKSICISHQGGLSTHLLESKDLFELKKLRDKGKAFVYKSIDEVLFVLIMRKGHNFGQHRDVIESL